MTHPGYLVLVSIAENTIPDIFGGVFKYPKNNEFYYNICLFYQNLLQYYHICIVYTFNNDHFFIVFLFILQVCLRIRPLNEDENLLGATQIAHRVQEKVSGS